MEEEEYASVEDLLASSLELESVSSTASRSTEILDPTPPEMAANETPAVQEQDEDDLSMPIAVAILHVKTIPQYNLRLSNYVEAVPSGAINTGRCSNFFSLCLFLMFLQGSGVHGECYDLSQSHQLLRGDPRGCSLLPTSPLFPTFSNF